MLNEENAIRQKAYEIWQAEGQRDGEALSHWLRAQEEISWARPAATRSRRVAAPKRAGKKVAA